ncbi:hypothetical protein [Bacillus suaedae]|uniref:Pilus assembly protein PilO n=1 Tax=Halalkalibacter suaedae TaxID=2822140 RepID=A0A941ASQ2_9BACI|nr:hypothetical protein [Bacillus suaedae]MBP3949649.1 hypothetical protein [Bacillus suaedae]
MVELQPGVKRLLIAFITLLLIAIPFFLYYTYVKPLKLELDRSTQQLETEEQLLASVESELAKRETQITTLNSTGLQKQVPVAPLLDQFLLDLERSEILSESLILNYQFSMSSFEGLESDEAATLEEEMDTRMEEQQTDVTDSDAVNEGEVPTPEGIEKITSQMTVVSPSYDEMMVFLKEIEKLQRITTVNQLTFSGNQEVRLLDQTVDDLQYTIEVSTYYLPGLSELQEDLPTHDHEDPSNKSNPLYYGVKEDQ